MRVVVVGGTGTIGSAVVERARPDHEVVVVGNTNGDHQVDLASADSVRALLDAVGDADAIVCAAGLARFGALDDLSDEDFAVGLENKLMGQVNLVRFAIDRLRDGGSITVTTGVLATEPTVGSAAISLVNAGLEGFVRAAALELPRGLRVNAVSPPWVAETLEAMGRDPGPGMPAADVALAYLDAVEGDYSGRVVGAREFAP